VVFADLTPARLILAVRPDVYVKGGDYDLATLPERGLVQRLGGEVRILAHVPGRSTTETLVNLANASTHMKRD
jgi:bifunctional ADP-heptose synthase (sugar kinase/adenylyltransferase)